MTSDLSPLKKNSADLSDLEKWPKLHWGAIASLAPTPHTHAPHPVAAPMRHTRDHTLPSSGLTLIPR